MRGKPVPAQFVGKLTLLPYDRNVPGPSGRSTTIPAYQEPILTLSGATALILALKDAWW